MKTTNKFARLISADEFEFAPTLVVLHPDNRHHPDGSPRTDGLYRNRGTGAFSWGADKTA